MKQIDISKPVKFRNPEKGEENLIFRITNFNEETERCYIKPINLEGWLKGIEPEELVSIHELINT